MPRPSGTLAENPRIAVPPRDDSFAEWRRYLWHLGHGLDSDYTSMEADGDKGDNWRAFKSRVTSPSDPRFKAAVASYQAYNLDPRRERSPHAFVNLDETGELDKFTMGSVFTRACYHRDRSPLPFGNGQPKWVTSPSNPVVFVWLGPDRLRMNAANYGHAGMAFKQVCGINIVQGSRGQEDIYANSVSIDGDSNVLADSYSPGRNETVRSRGGQRRVKQRYDIETRIFNVDANFITVGFHELEHALWADGHLALNRFPGEIINPSYTGSRFTLRNGVWIVNPGPEEVRQMRLCYGDPVQGPIDPPPGGEGDITIFMAAREGDGDLVYADRPFVIKRS